MTDLYKLNCNDLPNDLGALDDNGLSVYLELLNNQSVPQWQLSKESATLVNTYSFKNYYQTIAFVNIIAQIAHQQDHHPELKVSYNRCTVIYSTHSVDGISIKDFICAAKINAAQTL